MVATAILAVNISSADQTVQNAQGDLHLYH